MVATDEQLVLFGSVDAQGNLLGDTWSFDGSRWTQLPPYD
jgi:hypothetical protein